MTTPQPISAYSDLAIYQEMSDCKKCGGQQIFIVVFEFGGGRAGYCVGCGDERILPFTRSMEESSHVPSTR